MYIIEANYTLAEASYNIIKANHSYAEAAHKVIKVNHSFVEAAHSIIKANHSCLEVANHIIEVNFTLAEAPHSMENMLNDNNFLPNQLITSTQKGDFLLLPSIMSTTDIQG